MTAQPDLFGNPLATAVANSRSIGRRPVNDMDSVERVLGVAEKEGYVLVGVAERVFHKVGRSEITPASGHEAEVVHQLLDAKWLTKGGTHTYNCGGYEGLGNSVLVPKKTREKARLWRNLAPLPKNK
ncbi:hypothetical protein ORV05_02060 [Amycolatopsis cynarae]|uniref:Uncharacterized protein n=1 Tax=Amycolatopsis cynarae TaxID=2995223 RepID=A0ABY7B5D1_9PSEU|nr:hypothetical protein [Amycolatopsis sp. HUAS 11-8]WAL66624.1 hypothetical protein ORV05_02060 [Amycolatopsis sp. HUAS 11-8]